MVILLMPRDRWCYSFDNPDIKPDNVENFIMSDDEVVFIDKPVSGEERKLFLLIAALDTIINKYEGSQLHDNGREEVKEFLLLYHYHKDLVWEVAVALGTSDPEDVIKWLNK